MDFNMENTIDFDELLNKETHYITRTQNIFDSIRSQPDAVSKTTAENKVNNFKSHMLFFYNSTNPFLQRTHSYKDLPELQDIHYKMCHFLLEKEYIKINKNHSTDFDWHIPSIFMPIFTTYILSIKHNYQKIPVKCFFNDFEQSLTITIQKYNKEHINAQIPEQSILNWVAILLGKNFYIRLENMLNHYADTPEQKNMLSDAVKILSYIQKQNIKPNMYVNNCTIKLLSYFMDTLDKHLLTDKNHPKNLDPLYNHLVPFTPNREKEYIKLLLSNSKTTIENIKSFSYSFHHEYTKKNDYPLAVNNFDNFSLEINKLMSNILAIKQSLSSNISDFYEILYNDLFSRNETSKLISESILLPYYENLAYHIDFYTEKFVAYYAKITNICKKYIKNVQISSSKHPEKSQKADLRYLTLDDFYSDLDFEYNKLEKTIYEKHSSLRPFLQHNTVSIIEENKFPDLLYDSDQLAHLLSILENDEKKYSPTYIKSKLINYKFPVYYDELIHVLETYKTYL